MVHFSPLFIAEQDLLKKHCRACTGIPLFNHWKSAMDLFDHRKNQILRSNAPLADRMRPRTLDEYIGQEHIVGPGRLLRRAIQADQLSSVIFYGPPGTGKTTLARIIANTTKAQFISINAVLAGVKDIREAIDRAQETLKLYGKRTILFVDEVHRFNKAQQDALLPHVENGILILIGATTENPYFEVNKALVSRSRIFQLRGLTDNDLAAIARQAIADKERGYGSKVVFIDDDALAHLVKVANGDARGVLNALELAVETTEPQPDSTIHIDRAIAEESIQQRAVLYDKDGDAHYDTISAFIKSMRGSDPDAALYWMAKMVYAGEDPRFIFRRMIILACEDVGMADPLALGVVMDAAQAFDYVGLPEGRYHLAHACLYLSTAPKSNSSMAFFDALSVVGKEATDDIPNHLRDKSRDADGFGHGEGYLYPHAYRDHWVAQQYLPDAMQGKVFYQPSQIGFEKSIADNVARMREAQIEAMTDEGDDGENSGTNSTKAAWVRRTILRSGDQIAHIRDTIFSKLALDRDAMALDLCGRTGAITFEALRQVPEGGVWSIANDDNSFNTLTSMSKNLPTLRRPQIVRSNKDLFDVDLCAVAGGSIRFDAIAGRNIFFDYPDKSALALRIAKLLAPDGRSVFAETVASEGQRIAPLLAAPREKPDLLALFQKAEDVFYGATDDPVVNWNIASIAEQLGNLSGIQIRTQSEELVRRLKFSIDDVTHWLRFGANQGRKTLGDRVLENASEQEFNQIKDMVIAQISNREIEWKTVICYLEISLKS